MEEKKPEAGTSGAGASAACYSEKVQVPRRMPHVYHVMIVGTVKDSLVDEAGSDVGLIRRQHDCLVRILRELNLRVISIDLQGSFHAYLLVEHIAISCNGIVFLPRPRTVADQNNAKKLKNILKYQCSQVIVEQRDPTASVCGADVLFTGVEMIVGLSRSSNEAGARELAEAFPDYPVTAFKMPAGADHIKNYVSVAGDMTLAVGPGPLAKDIINKIMRRVSRSYEIIDVVEPAAANCLFVNQTLIHQAIEEIPESFKIFIERSRYTRRSICFSEFTKLHAGLASVCIPTKKMF